MTPTDLQSLEKNAVPSWEPVGDGRALPCTRLAFWRQYLTTMRPYLFPVSGLAGLSGMALAGVTDPWRLGLALAVFTFSYGFGQALTDCFQRDTDRLSAPYRPLVRGRISVGQVLLVSLAGLLVSMGALAYLNPWNLVMSACAIGGLLAYTPLKRLWWAGPIANASIVALLPIMGWLVRPGNGLGGLGRRPEVLVTALMSLAAYANFVLAGYLKDVRADRQTGYNTFPVRFGWKRTACLSHVWAGVALGAGAWAVRLLTDGATRAASAAWLLVLAAGFVSILAQVALQKVRREEKAYFPIINVVRVFLLLHAAVVVSALPAWWPIAAGFCVAFEVVVRVRPDRCQV